MHVLKRQETGLMYFKADQAWSNKTETVYSLSIHRIQIQKWAKS